MSLALSNPAWSSTDFSKYKELILQNNPNDLIHYNPSQNEYQPLRLSNDRLKEVLEVDNLALAQNKIFKVVEFKVLSEFTDEAPTLLSDEALPLTDLDARNVLFHLMRARAFYKKLDPQNAALDQPAIVRVRTNRKYNAEAHAGTQVAYNLSAHIPKHFGNLWEQEIWFGAQKDSFNITKKKVLLAILGSLSYIWAGPGALATIPTTLFSGYKGGVDMAKQPSEIYHEAFHWATNTEDLLPAGRYSHPLSENLANYFGSSIEGKPEFRGLKSFSDRRLTVSYRELKDVKRSRISLVYDYTSFVPTFLWAFRLQKILSADETDQLAWKITQAATHLSFPSDVPGMIRAALAGHPNTPAIEALLERYECSFHNLNERFKIYYEDINGLKLPDRPRRCGTEEDKKI